jgi:aspartyl-tRNA(Asn)/glutamyl-tRNA(Gln) amidotransferase subunit A
MKSLILKLHKQIIQGDTTITQIINDAILKCKKHDITASLITDNYQTAQKKAQELQEHISLHKDDLLYGIPYVLKDNVCTKNLRTTAGSAFLSDFIPPYNATIYELFNANHAVLIAKSNMDEFGMGGSGIHSAYGIVKNIHDHNFTVGGSSSGSVNLVANQVVPFAIGSDTGDSSRRPASFTNTTGYKPTYGLISRYGMMPYAPSLDHVGIIASFVADIAIVAQAIVKFDEKDFTSQKVKNNNFFNNLKQVDKLTIGVISGIEKYLQPEIASAYTECLKKLKEHKFVIKPIEIKNEHLVAIKTIYSIISYAEANSC